MCGRGAAKETIKLIGTRRNATPSAFPDLDLTPMSTVYCQRIQECVGPLDRRGFGIRLFGVVDHLDLGDVEETKTDLALNKIVSKPAVGQMPSTARGFGGLDVNQKGTKQ